MKRTTVSYLRNEALRSKELILIALLVVGITIANATTIKIIHIGSIMFTAGALAYPITFAVTDIIGDVFGPHEGRKFVWIGFLSQLIFVFFAWFVVVMPAAPFLNPKITESVRVVFYSVPRIVFASLVAYLVSQTHDVWAFDFWKRKVPNHLWVRNNFSTFVSQMIDTILFIGIAFIGVLTWRELFGIALAEYTIKLIVALIDTPFVYTGIHWMTGKWGTSQTLEEALAKKHLSKKEDA